MYTSASMDMLVAPQPQGVSLQCLACHDGILASNHSLSNDRRRRQAAPEIFGLSGTLSTGTDLRNDHPISVTYDAAKDRGFHPALLGKVGDLPLYGPNKDQLECTSCHDPHSSTHPAMLRQSNAGSAMCLTCHDK
jgi:predicted CXXCH cytochrome family protein